MPEAAERKTAASIGAATVRYERTAAQACTTPLLGHQVGEVALDGLLAQRHERFDVPSTTSGQQQSPPGTNLPGVPDVLTTSWAPWSPTPQST